MEEILASIRRIIADDQDGGQAVATGAEPRPAPSARPSPTDDDSPDLGELKPALEGDRALEPEHEKDSLSEPEEALAEESVAAGGEFDREADQPGKPPPPHRRPLPQRDSLLSPIARSTAAHAFQKLSTTVLSTNPRTLEDVVTEMLRPMLKSWLDENLPPLVERLVRAEIERVARGGP
jgi:uncharacterized protein